MTLALSGCGGGSGDSSSSADEVATKIEAACTKAAGYSVWLPEHQAKEGLSSAEVEAIADESGEELHATLESLDPPADLRRPVEELVSFRLASTGSRAKLIESLAEEERLYRAVGADRCAASVHASVLTLKGASVESAYRQVGLPLPPKPPDW